MKTWSTESDGRGDLYTDETPIRPLDEKGLELVRVFIKKRAPEEDVEEMLEMLGLTDAAQ